MSAFFGSALLAANITTSIYEHTGTTPITVNIRMANQNNEEVSYWVWMGPTASPEKCITPGVTVDANAPWEDVGMRMDPGEKIWAMATKGNVSVRAFGAEDQ
ncbi:hypothetical protein KDX38_08410 [Pseudomonas sp. CDFA 602]|uniref:hypothetical protein n=1 Tax=Pseudomonas californiensis TaxID=2829823 RepID=UPI001E5440E5|nr:hypothetical protein [Pseudomonas californiensis]MCD5993642.1 hypothetical protein [Pseudomonas californiensis]MCD5999237.1 hypothetical protein [Pseudomonas californiensis]